MTFFCDQSAVTMFAGAMIIDAKESFYNFSKSLSGIQLLVL